MAQLAYACEGPAQSSVMVPTDVLAPTVSLFCDAGVLASVVRDSRSAGLTVRGVHPLEHATTGRGGILGEVVVLECREINGPRLAALVRIDERAARAGAAVVVITSRAALEDVFGCCESSRAQILVDPSAAECALALGGALMRVSRGRVRELDDEDRIALVRLTEEVGRLAAKLDRLALPLGGERAGSMTAQLASPSRDYRGGEQEREMLRRPRPPLPDPRLIQLIIRQRRLRDRFFEPGLFADPAWDILLDLTVARAEHRRVSVTSLCIAAAVPATTALRWIAQMSDAGILIREQDEEDRRRAFIALSDRAADAMARYFEELGKDASRAV